MNFIDMRFISVGASLANSHWARDPRFDQDRLVLLDSAQDVVREPVGVVGLAALGLKEVVAADEPADCSFVENRCLDRRGADDQDTDAAGDSFGSQGQRHSDDGVLGRHVAGDLAGRGEPRHRRGVDDVAVTLAQHLRIGGRHTVHDTADVDVDDRVPLVQREQFGVAAPADACVVEHQIQSAGAVHHFVDRRRDGGGVGHIQSRCPCPIAEPGGRRLGGVAVDVGADHVGACVHQRAAQRRADARSGTGDNGRLCGETHCASASLMTWAMMSGYFFMWAPPLMSSTSPVTHDDFGEHRYSTASAMSSGVPARPSAVLSM